MGLLGKNVADRRVLANEKIPEFFMQLRIFFRPCRSGGTLPANLQPRNDMLLPVNLLVQEVEAYPHFAKARNATSEVWISFKNFPSSLLTEK